MKILHLISQHPESTGSGFYLQNILRQATVAGHRNFLVAGISGNRLPQLDCISSQSCRFVHFDQGALDYTIPGMSDVMAQISGYSGRVGVFQLTSFTAEPAQAIAVEISTATLLKHCREIGGAAALNDVLEKVKRGLVSTNDANQLYYNTESWRI